MRTTVKTAIGFAAGAAMLSVLGGCVAGGGAYYANDDGYVYYDGYYDGYYGPFVGGYWGSDGYFYYQDRDYGYHRDEGRHFRHDHFDGGKAFHHRGRRDHDRGDHDRDHDRGDHDRRGGYR
jgi:hypothetical protein